MKQKKLLFVAIAVVTMNFSDSARLTDAERKYASTLLRETKEHLLKEVNTLTEAQWNFKVDADSWSIAECVEHLAITEYSLFGLAQKSLKVPADPSKRNEVKMNDESLVKMIADRSTKVKTPEASKPTGKFGTYTAALNEFSTTRDHHMNYIETTSEDLRNHYHDFHFGKVDAYQVILFMAGHTKRHIDQIEEIKRNINFPKKGE